MSRYYVIDMWENTFPVFPQEDDESPLSFEELNKAKEYCFDNCQNGYVLDFEKMKVIKPIRSLEWKIGNDIGKEIITNVDFKSCEPDDEDKITEIFYEVYENRKQYSDFSVLASNINIKENSEELWEQLEKGLGQVLSDYLNKY